MTTDDEKTEEETTETAAEEAAEEAVEAAAETAEAATSDAVEPAEAATAEGAEPAEAAAPEAETTEDNAGAAAAGEAYDPSVAGAAAHLFGVSRPQDEYGTREVDRDAMSDDELLAMGVEPDDGPGIKLVGVFVAMTVILVISGVGTAALFGWVKDIKQDGLSNRVHYTLAQSRSEAAEVLNAYEDLEGEDGAAAGYRVPIDVAMDILVNNESLLAGHEVDGDEAAEIPGPEFEGFEAPRVAVSPTSINVHGSAGWTRSGGTAGDVVVAPIAGGAPAGAVIPVPVPTPDAPTAVDPPAGHDHGHDDHAGHGH